MLYTTYFGYLRHITDTDHIIPISIAAKPPKWWNGLEYRKLAPSYGCLMNYKSDKNTDVYSKRYYEETLKPLDPNDVICELIQLLPRKNQLQIDMVSCPLWENPHIHIALVCYEIPEDFCHRHIDRAWFNKYGIMCNELCFCNRKCLNIDVTNIIG